MAIQITSLQRGFKVDFAGDKGKGIKVAYAGQDVFFDGLIPAGYDLNRIVVDCLPALASLSKVSASQISHARLKALPKTKKVSKKQIRMELL